MIFQIEKVGTSKSYFFKDDIHLDYKEFDFRVNLYLKEIYTQIYPHEQDNKYDKGFLYRCPYKNCTLRNTRHKLLLHLRKHVRLTSLKFSTIFDHTNVKFIHVQKDFSHKLF
jgi:hypothetical protein